MQITDRFWTLDLRFFFHSEPVIQLQKLLQDLSVICFATCNNVTQSVFECLSLFSGDWVLRSDPCQITDDLRSILGLNASCGDVDGGLKLYFANVLLSLSGHCRHDVGGGFHKAILLPAYRPRLLCFISSWQTSVFYITEAAYRPENLSVFDHHNSLQPNCRSFFQVQFTDCFLCFLSSLQTSVVAP